MKTFDRFVGALFFVYALAILPVAAKTIKTAARPVSTLCKAHEKIILSCAFNNGKIVSICGSSGLSKSSGFLQYRYGRAGKLPLSIYPEALSDSKNKFWFYPDGFEPYVGTTSGSTPDGFWETPGRNLSFKSNESYFTLQVYKNLETYESFASLMGVVEQKSENSYVIDLNCSLKKAVNNFKDLIDLNLPLQPE